MRKKFILIIIFILFFLPSIVFAMQPAGDPQSCTGIQTWAAQQPAEQMPTIKMTFPACYPGQSGTGYDVFVQAFETAFVTIGQYIGNVAFALVLGAVVFNVVALGLQVLTGREDGSMAIGTIFKGLLLLGMDLELVDPNSNVYIGTIAGDLYQAGQGLGQALIGFIYNQITIQPPGTSSFYSSIAKSVIPQTFTFDPVSIFEMGLRLATLELVADIAHVKSIFANVSGPVDALMAIFQFLTQLGFIDAIVGLGAGTAILVVFGLLAGEIFGIIIFSFWTISSISLVLAIESIKRFAGKPFGLSVNYSGIYQTLVCLAIRVLVMYMILGLGFAAVAPVIVGSVSGVTNLFQGLIVIGVTFLYFVLAKQAPAFTQVFGCNNPLSNAFAPVAQMGASMAAGAAGGAAAAMKTGGDLWGHLKGEHVLAGAKAGAKHAAGRPSSFEKGEDGHHKALKMSEDAQGGPSSGQKSQEQQKSDAPEGLVDSSGKPVTSSSFDSAPSNKRSSEDYSSMAGTNASPSGNSSLGGGNSPQTQNSQQKGAEPAQNPEPEKSKIWTPGDKPN